MEQTFGIPIKVQKEKLVKAKEKKPTSIQKMPNIAAAKTD